MSTPSSMLSPTRSPMAASCWSGGGCLHARIVETLEALAGERLAEVAAGRSLDQIERLAHHALRGEVWDKALIYCRQAGEKAVARSAYREAVGSLEQALSALAHLPETHDTCELA